MFKCGKPANLNVGLQAIKPERTNQCRGHVCVNSFMVGITITPRQKCQASLVIKESSYVAMARLTSPALPQPLTLCNLSMSNQTLSGSWKYKCQVLLHENSLGSGDKQPRLCFPFLEFLFFFHSSVFFMIPLLPSLLHSLLFPFFLCLCYGTHGLSTCLRWALQ